MSEFHSGENIIPSDVNKSRKKIKTPSPREIAKPTESAPKEDKTVQHTTENEEQTDSNTENVCLEDNLDSDI
ncbi:hypothetical protein ILUMI_00128 [Ignelater luminosus]|uniref:Uncharacterized protein n=1 Tax=Ignelater luminosus TaxID=2038154 RepID=A0A8K0DL35_IGNLU|nr:hypothetical protein ILUMI_00128 [Ignelater luminosus]